MTSPMDTIPGGTPLAPTGPGPGGAVQQSVDLPEMTRGVQVGAERIGIYGPGCVGKTALCGHLASVGIKPFFVDVDRGSRFINVDRRIPASFMETRAILQDHHRLREYGAVVVDSGTSLQDQAVEWVLQNIRHEKGHAVKNIEGYGYGKGYTHVYETFLLVLADLDAIVRELGLHVVIVCHECTANVPNPGGEDWIRYEPRLQQPKNSGQLRSRVKEWVDHLFFVDFDVFVSEDGKASGSSSRSIYTTPMPTHIAKSRVLSETIPYEKGSGQLWKLLFNKE